MHITLRVAEKSRHKEKYITCLAYKPEKASTVKLNPIPEFVGETNCKCGQPAIFMAEPDFYCSNCINELIGKSEVVSTECLFSPSVAHAIDITIFEWSTNRERWYRLRGSNVQPDSTSIISAKELERRFNELMIEIITGSPQEADAEYEKEDKQLRIFV